jgi:hypothetical protein
MQINLYRRGLKYLSRILNIFVPLTGHESIFHAHAGGGRSAL